jgi:hypothetical protein
LSIPWAVYRVEKVKRRTINVMTKATHVNHFRQQESPDDPVRVPVVKLEEATARHNHGILHVDDGVQLGVASDFLLHESAQVQPNLVQRLSETAEILVIDFVENLWRLFVVVGCPLLKFTSARVKVLLDPLMDFILRGFLAVGEFGHEVIERFQSLIGRLLKLHVNESLRVVVNSGHLDGIKEPAMTVNFTEEMEVSINLWWLTKLS